MVSRAQSWHLGHVVAKVVGVRKIKDLVNQWYGRIVTAPARVSCVSVKGGKPEICLRTAEG